MIETIYLQNEPKINSFLWNRCRNFNSNRQKMFVIIKSDFFLNLAQQGLEFSLP